MVASTAATPPAVCRKRRRSMPGPVRGFVGVRERRLADVEVEPRRRIGDVLAVRAGRDAQRQAKLAVTVVDAPRRVTRATIGPDSGPTCSAPTRVGTADAGEPTRRAPRRPTGNHAAHPDPGRGFRQGIGRIGASAPASCAVTGASAAAAWLHASVICWLCCHADAPSMHNKRRRLQQELQLLRDRCRSRPRCTRPTTRSDRRPPASPRSASCVHTCSSPCATGAGIGFAEGAGSVSGGRLGNPLPDGS